MRHQPVGHRLRHPIGRAGPVASQDELAHAPQVHAAIEFPEEPRRGGMQHIAGNDRTRRGRGRGRVVRQAAMHHADDLNRRRIPPGGPRGRAGDAGRLASLGRRHQVEYHAIGYLASQLKHPRPECGQVDRQVGPQMRAIKRTPGRHTRRPDRAAPPG